MAKLGYNSKERRCFYFMITWQIEKRNIQDLRGYDKNPRRFTEKGLKDLKESLKKCGDANIITINADNTVLGGHARLTVMKQLGYKEVDVKVPNRLLNEQEVKEVVIRLNANTAGEWDMDKLQADFELDDLQEWGLDVEFNTDELVDKEVEEIEVPEEVETKCQPGNIWQLGNHRLMCGSSTSADDVKKLMAGQEVDLLVTDPPYNVNYEGSNGLKIQNDNMEDLEFRQFLVDAFKSADEVMKLGAVFYIWHADSEGYNFRGACHDINWKVRQCLIWNKNSLVLGRQDYHWKHEPCLYGWKDGASHYFIDDRSQTTVIEDKKDDFKKMPKAELVKLLEEIYAQKLSTTVIDCEKPARNAEHPTMKPIKLIAQQIKNSSKINQVVLDLFGGSGSTLIACEQLNRKNYTMELDPHYCDVIIQRWENLTGKKAVLCEQ